MGKITQPPTVELTRQLFENGAEFRFKNPKPGWYRAYMCYESGTIMDRHCMCHGGSYHATLSSITDSSFVVLYKLMGSEIKKEYYFSEFELQTQIISSVK